MSHAVPAESNLGEQGPIVAVLAAFVVALPGVAGTLALIALSGILGPNAVYVVSSASVGITIFIVVLLLSYIIKVHANAGNELLLFVVITAVAAILTGSHPDLRPPTSSRGMRRVRRSDSDRDRHFRGAQPHRRRYRPIHSSRNMRSFGVCIRHHARGLHRSGSKGRDSTTRHANRGCCRYRSDDVLTPEESRTGSRDAPYRGSGLPSHYRTT